MRKITRRSFLRRSACGVLGAAGASLIATRHSSLGDVERTPKRPNILFAIADDWSWPYASVYGARAVQTPTFDRIAREGWLFSNAFTAAPQCSPNRAATLTGRNIWQLEEAGTHASIFPNKFVVFPDLLEKAGYHVGFTAKGWGPGDWRRGGWSHNPAGHEYSSLQRSSVPANGISKTDYAANFAAFLERRPDDVPFFFWFGAHEPHRRYEVGSGARAGKNRDDVTVPSFLPDDPIVRNDLLDYFLEVEWFDSQLGAMLARLESIGELENTLIVATSDNGMPFPRAKANLYEYGTHVPLAIRWPERVKAGTVSEALIGFIDFAPTFLEVAGVAPPAEMTGRSFLNLLTTSQSSAAEPPHDCVLTGRERHTHARYDNLGYPSRAIRTQEYLYIRNFKPDRWPAGDPDGYHDTDESPTKTFMIEKRDIYPELFEAAFGKRPAEELYDIRNDPGCMHNLAARDEYAAVRKELSEKLNRLLVAQKDPRALGTGDIFESYPRVSGMRPQLGGFAERGKYNPKYQRPAETPGTM
jgi:N-sulfoglucosamine sulfohydrolase